MAMTFLKIHWVCGFVPLERARIDSSERYTHPRNEDLVLFRAPGCEFGYIPDLPQRAQRAGIGDEGLRLKGGAGVNDMPSMAAECSGVFQSGRRGRYLTTVRLVHTCRRRDPLRLRGGQRVLLIKKVTPRAPTRTSNAKAG
jgi:hypothetical protein